MNIQDIGKRLQKLSRVTGTNFAMGIPTSRDAISHAEQRLNVLFPEQIKIFYSNINGLKVEDPKLEIFPIENVEKSSEDRLIFAILAGAHPLYFDLSRTNEANQWDIVAEDGFVVTKTMASFWSNKIWAWVERRRSILEEIDDQPTG